MANLVISFVQKTTNDLNEVSETVNVYSATIDERILPTLTVYPTTTSDAAARTDFKADLTAIGYVWNTES